MTGRLVTSASLALVSALVLVSCARSDVTSNAAPPTFICGTTLSNSAAGAVVTDATEPGTVSVTSPTVGFSVFLKVSPRCDEGATVAVTPSTAMQVTAEAPARDKKLAGLVLHPTVPDADVTVTHADGTTTMVLIRLTEIAPSPGTATGTR